MPLTRNRKKATTLFNVVTSNLLHLEAEETKLKDKNIPPENKPNESIHKIQKGLYFVHLYSAFEKSVNELIVRTLAVIESKSVKNKHYSLAFNTIAMDAKLMSYKSAGKDRALGCAVSIFESMGLNEHTKLNESMFAPKLQNVWFDTAQLTLMSFGIPPLSDPNGQLKTSVDEVVDKRNAVAHGRMTADIVGGFQRCDVLQDRTTAVQTVLELITDTLEDFLVNKKYIAEDYRHLY
ncbi:hypothetical protein BBM24_05515 [Vibrio parahaemolyticus]|uniref:MAE_28990/MAE_18760 family HEPN-like nuclease n=1 Tax=Vibrio parahaemolyticus TaxID=670 RepID=UPI00079FF8E6|nr:MAE_28990/MAE_18760 family HEPN-like nuclease [Vibrio parahaemolyticus]EGQ7680550.1 hypothetical protein [Vibrio parahaemolyticus]EGQ8242060.1 hypothetical protein [Vibrio parahaemolyticus]EGQ9353813.1 hypothetical protein [Vibrio parahaemolyticus]EGQ9512774.1 hypothetical protein [Vibrio parahaemolyticus]EHK2854845.1 hypothetical protein [Vibrio parahaemolyticus]